MITLRLATPADRRKIYDWLANSDLTSSMLGAPQFPENPVPTWEEFVDDYHDHFFDGPPTRSGRCYIILIGGTEVGHVSHNEIENDDATELDIWLAGSQFAGKGYGSSALILLCEDLSVKFQCSTFFIAPSRRNARAVASYRKAGFTETTDRPDWFVPDYRDVLVMKKEMGISTFSK